MNDVIVDIADPEDDLLRNWRWLIPETHRVLFASVLGDLFLKDERGSIYWLDVGSAELQRVAENEHLFKEAWQDDETYNYWLGPSLVQECCEAGLVRMPHECFSYVMLPMVGGQFKPSNFKVRTLRSHLDGWGPICEQLTRFPDGSRVRIRVTK